MPEFSHDAYFLKPLINDQELNKILHFSYLNGYRQRKYALSVHGSEVMASASRG